MNPFLARSLSSKELIALLFLCESKRKGRPRSPEELENGALPEWEEMLSTFAERFAHTAEALRFEVLEAHLMSVEDLDIYDDEALRRLLDENRDRLALLVRRLEQDPRFQLGSG